jgi:hypothetical protein
MYNMDNLIISLTDEFRVLLLYLKSECIPEMTVFRMHSRKSECIPDTQKTRLARALESAYE